VRVDLCKARMDKQAGPDRAGTGTKPPDTKKQSPNNTRWQRFLPNIMALAWYPP